MDRCVSLWHVSEAEGNAVSTPHTAAVCARMEPIHNLLILYCGAVFVNLLIAFYQWRSSRSAAHRNLVLFWFFALFAFLDQAVLDQSSFTLASALCMTFAVNLTLAKVIAEIALVSFRWLPLALVMVACWCASAVLFALDAPFWAVTGPVAVGSGGPLFVVLWRAFPKWSGLSLSERALLVAALINVLHLLDYPFMRPDPELAVVGFTVGIMLVLAIGVLGPTCMTETVSRRSREALARQAEALELTNEQLEQFAHTASHDLREPLRHLALYSDLLQASLPRGRSRQSVSYADEIRTAALDLEQRVRTMLEDARSGRIEPRRASVELDDVFRAAMEALRHAIEKTRAEIHVDPLPAVYADPDLLALVFQNLVGNALRYRGEEVPRVQVAASKERKGWRISVSDRGIGIPAEYHERIFEPFFRLDPRRKDGGSGVGLSICKRLVEAHGGEIGVISAPDEGSTFHFAIPDVEPPSDRQSG
jgi:signal transduction histidine kinase